MKIEAKDVNDYLSKLDDDRRAALTSLHALVEKVAPQAEATLDYGMPTYKIGQHAVASMASQKNYMSLYLDVELLAEHKEAFGHLNCGKACVRFKRLEQLPLDTVETIIQGTAERLNS